MDANSTKVETHEAYRRSQLEDSVMGRAVVNRLPGSHYLQKGARVYIAGPIARKPNGNREAFQMFAEALKARGLTPVNPHDISPDHAGSCMGADIPVVFGDSADPHKYGCYMKPDLLALLTCEAALFLPGWATSTGAKVERDVASICGLTIIEHYEMHEVEGGA